jgi:hypothetical protein
VFFGLPEIEDNLKKDPPLLQRVAIRVRLDPFDLQSTDAYIRHRLRMAGADRRIMDNEAIRLIHKASGGVPRLINTVCDNALLEGSLARAAVIGPDLIRSIATNLGLPTEQPVTAADYLKDEPGASHLPTIIPGHPASPPTADIAPGPKATELALDEIDRVLAALGKLG